MTRRMILALRVFGRSPTNLTASGRSGLPSCWATMSLISSRSTSAGSWPGRRTAKTITPSPFSSCGTPLAVAPEAAGHAGPGLTDDQLADLATNWPTVLVDHVGGHAGDRAGEAARL